MNPKKIALFGATGKTGIEFLKITLNKYEIKALVRNPLNININSSNLELIQGDITHVADVENVITGCDVVVNLIGHVKNSPHDLQTVAIENIIKSMEKHKIKRLISLTGGGVRDLKNDQPKFMDNAIVFIMKNLAGKGTHNALLDGISRSEDL